MAEWPSTLQRQEFPGGRTLAVEPDSPPTAAKVIELAVA